MISILSLAMLASASGWAAQGQSYAYLADTSGIYTAQFADDCAASAAEAAKNLPAAEQALGASSGTLSVDPQIQWVSNGPVHHPAGEAGTYECFLVFGSSDERVSFEREATPVRSHLTKSEQGTACKPEFDSLSSEAGALYTVYQTGWTLFQGRICNVDHVAATR